MSTIDTRIDPFTKSPSRQNPSTFSEDMDTRLAEENSRITQMNDMSSEMNVVATEVNDNANTASTKALEASNSASIATASANYKGLWVPNYNTVGYPQGVSVGYSDGFNYVSNIANNLTEPTSKTNTAEWNWIETINPEDYYDKAESDGLLDLKAPLSNPTFLDTQTLPRAIISYNDADRVFTIGTSTADAIYEYIDPSGTIVGKNSNGSYWKYVDGRLVCAGFIVELLSLAVDSVAVLPIPTSPYTFFGDPKRFYTVGLRTLISQGGAINTSTNCLNGSNGSGTTGGADSCVIKNVGSYTSTSYAMSFLFEGVWK